MWKAIQMTEESGLPLSISAKVQINMHFDDLSAFRQVSRFSHLTVPMLWFDIMMPKLPEALDTRFNFYLNILPYLDILGYWGSLLLGIALLLYAVTRATLRMSNLTQMNNISDGKYSKSNILRGVTNTVHCNDVYKPCEMKLLHQYEKHQQTLEDNNIITRHNDMNVDLLYKEMASAQQRQGSFALELEPALSGSESGDDDVESNSSASSSLCSHNSSTCSCLTDQSRNGQKHAETTANETAINVDIIESNQTQANTALSINANQAAQQTTTNNSRTNSNEQQHNNNSRQS